MKNILLTAVLIFSGVSAQAGSTQLISIKSEAEPGKIAYIGVNTDAKNTITEIYYKNDEGKIRNMPLASLAASKVLCSKKGYTLVTIKVPKYSATATSLNLTYYSSVFGNESGTKKYTIKYNVHVDKYEMYDENQRQISNAYVTTHRNMIGVAVGIEDIRAQ